MSSRDAFDLKGLSMAVDYAANVVDTWVQENPEGGTGDLLEFLHQKQAAVEAELAAAS